MMKIYQSKDNGVQVILQIDSFGNWTTIHGGDWYILNENSNTYLPVDNTGLARWLELKGLAKFNISFKHQVLLDGHWKKVDCFGLYKFVQTLGILVGSTITDEEWITIMAQVLEDKLYAQKHGKLP